MGSPRSTRTEEDKKEEERRWVMLAQAAIPTFPQGTPRASDPPGPDFLTTWNGHEIGIEVTRYFQDVPVHEAAMVRQRVAQRIEQRLAELLPSGACDVGLLHWASASSKIEGGWCSLADELALTVAESVRANAGTEEWTLEWEDLPDSARMHVTVVSIHMLAAGSVSRCHSPEAGWFDSAIPGVQQAIERKVCKASAYRRKVSVIYLLVVAPGYSLSSMASALREIRSHVFVGPFDRLFFLDVFENQGLELHAGRESVSHARS